jgi:palmitoyltransferase
MSQDKEKIEEDPLLEKTTTLTLLLDNENIEEITSYLKEELTDKDIMAIRFTSSQKSILIKLVLLDSDEFLNLFDIIKKKLTKEELTTLINLPDDNSNTPLLYATFKGSYEKVNTLIKHGAKVEMRNFMGLSVMHMAAQGDKPNMLIYFKDEFGFSINDRDFPGNTPLHWACHMAAENSINFLLSWMSDINILDRKGQTPLHLGIYHLKPKIIKKLIRKGADINLKDFSGRSVLDILNDQKMRVANFEKVLKVIHSIEPFKLCVYPNELMEISNENNYKELFNGFKDEDLKEKLIEKNNGNNKTDSEISKSYLTYQKIFNSLMFVCLHCFFEFLLYFFVLPKLNSITYYQIFWLLIISLFISFYVINKSDPGFLEPKDNLTWLEMVKNKVNINDYCPYCRVKKTKKTKHCHICQKCVKGFDHHCNWIDNCVGENNKKRFVIFVIITFINLIFNIVVGIVDLTDNNVVENPQKDNTGVMYNLESIMEMKYIFRYSINDLISILILIVSAFFCIPVFYVFFIQIKGIFIKENNYD